MSEELIISIIDQIEKEWIEDVKGYNLPWSRFNGYKWLVELRKRINEA